MTSRGHPLAVLLTTVKTTYPQKNYCSMRTGIVVTTTSHSKHYRPQKEGCVNEKASTINIKSSARGPHCPTVSTPTIHDPPNSHNKLLSTKICQ